MQDSASVADLLERRRRRRDDKRCPDCRGHVSIRGLRGEYYWQCLACDATGIGFRTRRAALEGVRR